MTRYLFLRLAMAFLCAVAAKAGADEAPLSEFWASETQGWVVETKTCDGSLCGYLVSYRATHPGDVNYVARDVHNPDPNRRADPLCGLLLMDGFKPSPHKAGSWDDGWIYDPEGGETYSGRIVIVDADTVKLRGYVGIPLFGRTLTLKREHSVTSRCAPPAGR